MLLVSTVVPLLPAQTELLAAAARAGAHPIADLAYCPPQSHAQALQVWEKILLSLPKSVRVGLRLDASQLPEATPFLSKLAEWHGFLVISNWRQTRVTSEQWPSGMPYWLEILDREDLSEIGSHGLQPEALVAKGHETGGLIGESPAFILTQQLLRTVELPIHTQGGIGPATAAACSAAGAAGVVLDDQLWAMREAKLPVELETVMRGLNGSETVVLGERLGQSIRVLQRPTLAGAAYLRERAEVLEQEDDSPSWRETMQAALRWEIAPETALPVGQAIGLGPMLAASFPTVGRLIRGIREGAADLIAKAARLQPLAAGNPLAESLGTRYPIVQGPMTRVSDVPPFAEAVAEGGGLPMLALALLKADRVKPLLEETALRLQDKPWGVGILGFVPMDLREEQLAVVEAVKPPFAIIAGGRPEQAARLDALGIRTFLHVPTPELLELYLNSGARRFIFEGRECGGHIGPLSSFTLWEQMVNRLMKVPSGQAGEFEVLFAGGVHDGLSARMVAAMCGGLAERGVKVGVLMGTAYLFTREAVESGAITPRFQAEAIACRQTVNLETGPGHASRCARTPFSDEFYATRRRLRSESRDRQKISEELEALTLGRLRMASKGLARRGAELTAIEEESQYREGMYMIGQAATLREQVGSIEELHESVCAGASMPASADVEVVAEASPDSTGTQAANIAIIGISSLLPGATDPEAFWRNLLDKENVIREIPRERWDWRLYYDADRQKRDHVYSKWGGFLDEMEFDPMPYGIPPSSLKSIEPMQLLGLEATRRALQDAGYDQPSQNHEQTSVIFGASGGMADLGQQYATRCEMPRMAGEVDPATFDRLPEWTQESFPGLLFNVSAGRVANRFDFGGSNFTVDAACASSLAAIDLAVRELISGRSKLALAGGIDTLQSVFAYFCFSKTQALSPSGQARSFDQKADGIVISEGVSVLVLKQLSEAVRDGDRVYAVIKGVGSSSDGRGSSMTAPTSTGQLRAMRRAYQMAGVSPATIQLYEAHGTGTPVGDRIELNSLKELMAESGASAGRCQIGSLKSLIGHTKSTAGVAGVAKAALALHHQVLPPHDGADQPLSPLGEADSPLVLRQEAVPWLRSPDHPRRAAASAFGFGGTNFHAVLEEAPPPLRGGAPGADRWPAELFCFSGDEVDAVSRILEETSAILDAEPDLVLRDLAFSLAEQADGTAPVAIAIVARDAGQLRERLALASQALRGAEVKLPAGVVVRREPVVNSPRIAFLFPGQGAQYPNAGRETALYFSEFGQMLEAAEGTLGAMHGRLLREWLYPAATQSEREAVANLARTDVAQPVIGVLSTAYLHLIQRLGLQPQATAGHSFGEFTALHAAGVLAWDDFLELAALRGRVMAGACEAASGGMAAVLGSRQQVAELVNGCGVVVANHNSPRQTVISGDSEALATALHHLEEAGLTVKALPVAGAFHSPLMEEAQLPLATAISTVPLRLPPAAPVYSNADGLPYENDESAMRERLSRHLMSSVEFVHEVEQLSADGINWLVEVGPRSILTNLVKEILTPEMKVEAVALDPDRGSMTGFLTSLAKLWAGGTGMRATELFCHRGAVRLTLGRAGLQQRRRRQPRLAQWLLSGGFIRRREEPAGVTGKQEPLRVETFERQEIAHTQPETAAPAKQSVNTMSIHPSAATKHQEPLSGSAGTKPTLPGQPNALLTAYASYQETMRQFLAVQEQVMRQFLSGSPMPSAPAQQETPSPILPPSPAAVTPSEPAPVAPAPEPQATPAPAPEPTQPSAAPAPLGRDSLTQDLLELVSDRTGYPVEALGLDQDVEADLGIDSIKRVEIFGAFQEYLPKELAAKIAADAESITRIRTLGGWVEAILEKADVH